MTNGGLTALPSTTFSAQGVLERSHLQAALRDNPSLLGDDLLVVAEEFGDFEGAHRRIDLLCVDRAGRLVVVELKRTEDGGHMELQALRYAAMVSAMTFDELRGVFSRHLVARQQEADAAESLLIEWMTEVDDAETVPTRDVRIILVSLGFDREITSTVLWLNDVYGLDIRCVRLTPYKVDSRLLLDVQQIIPLPEAADLTVQLRRREQAARSHSATGRDFTRYVITTPAGSTGALAKRRAIRAMVLALVERGLAPEVIKPVLPNAKFLAVNGTHEGHALNAALVATYPTVDLRRWFLDDPIPGSGVTWVLSKMWGVDTEHVLAALAALDTSGSVTYSEA